MSLRDNVWNDSYRKLMKISYRKIMKITLQAKRYNSMTRYNLVHHFIPMPQATNILDAKAAVDKQWNKLETIPARQLEKVKSKKEAMLEAQRDKNKVHFAT